LIGSSRLFLPPVAAVIHHPFPYGCVPFGKTYRRSERDETSGEGVLGLWDESAGSQFEFFDHWALD